MFVTMTHDHVEALMEERIRYHTRRNRRKRNR